MLLTTYSVLVYNTDMDEIKEQQLQNENYYQRASNIADELRGSLETENRKSFVIGYGDQNNVPLVEHLYAAGLIPDRGSLEKVVVESSIDTLTQADILDVNISTFYYPDIKFFSQHRINPLMSTFNFKDFKHFESRMFSCAASYTRLGLADLIDYTNLNYTVLDYNRRIKGFEDQINLINGELLFETQIFMQRCNGNNKDNHVVRNFFPLLEEVVKMMSGKK
ncbi:MAG: hypothetical protein UR47_C0003G0013 [candidate division WS6 bacterium GW2011_GWB1_33_6]|uniref:Uncharacterized protein n=1 Tax=candidate division WS6 bacterium GW2011_GWB1_33_6 TaxID=1619088 RepID=A0A0G0DIP7_9BACT|nr:MAG: hypothetical protein UR47_C0003G0013 [candidate division WS6 bacterium GW2011_GWB1_33_6]